MFLYTKLQTPSKLERQGEAFWSHQDLDPHTTVRSPPSHSERGPAHGQEKLHEAADLAVPEHTGQDQGVC